MPLPKDHAGVMDGWKFRAIDHGHQLAVMGAWRDGDAVRRHAVRVPASDCAFVLAVSDLFRWAKERGLSERVPL